MFKVRLDDVLDILVEVACGVPGRNRALIIPIELVSPVERNNCYLSFFVYRPDHERMLVGVQINADRNPTPTELGEWALISDEQGTWKDDAIHDFLVNTAKTATGPVDHVEVNFPSAPYNIPLKKVEVIQGKKRKKIKVGLLPSFRTA